MQVIAHRGDHQSAIENSLMAIEKAVNIGVDRIEIDLQLTSDLKIVICHDDHLLRISGQDRYLSQMSMKEVKEIVLKDGSTLPNLDIILESFIDKVEFNLEIKGNNPQLAKLAAEKCLRHQKWDQVLFSSFDLKPLEMLRDCFPQFRRAVLWGYNNLMTDHPSHFAPQIFMSKTQSSIIHPQIDLVSDLFMDQASHRGWKVYTWAPMKSIEDTDPKKLWNKLISLGVHGHCTNYPLKFKEFLQENR